MEIGEKRTFEKGFEDEIIKKKKVNEHGNRNKDRKEI